MLVLGKNGKEGSSQINPDMLGASSKRRLLAQYFSDLQEEGG
jgi:hypothetical protein